ncbi:DUF1028 domain-containing protein [Desertibaculum subflavum]|uniref:DUF1028 domain-containing protein n=1 Tax=Desertibaculum subflavum TaxID=2268458 RepID=UPI000E65EF08
MTWSILVRDPASGTLGLAVATRFFAVGALCLHADGGVGAVATQALVNPTFGPEGLRLLRQGLAPAEVVAKLTAGDPGRAHRQLHILDAKGGNARFTGGACIDWCGDLGVTDISVAGNMLAGPEVIAATARAYEAAGHLPLARRLIAALRAGEAAGGDKRGKQSAALALYSSEEYPDLSLRVDDHADPLAELERLEAVSRERFVHFRRFLPGRANPGGVFDREQIEAGITRSLADGE